MAHSRNKARMCEQRIIDLEGALHQAAIVVVAPAQFGR
jgi:hypothetical protein